ncbi:hypothetical protein [Ensifer aridi]
MQSIDGCGFCPLATNHEDDQRQLCVDTRLSQQPAIPTAAQSRTARNSGSERGRLDAAHDCEINTEAEIEIMVLQERLDEMRRKEILQIRDH